MGLLSDEQFPHMEKARLAGKKGHRILEFIDWLVAEYPEVTLPDKKENLLMRFYGVDIDGYHRDREAMTEAFKAGVKAIAKKEAGSEPSIIIPG